MPKDAAKAAESSSRFFEDAEGIRTFLKFVVLLGELFFLQTKLSPQFGQLFGGGILERSVLLLVFDVLLLVLRLDCCVALSPFFVEFCGLPHTQTITNKKSSSYVYGS